MSPVKTRPAYILMKGDKKGEKEQADLEILPRKAEEGVRERDRDGALLHSGGRGQKGEEFRM